MDGWVRVDPCAVASDQELTRWVQVGVAYAASPPPKQRGRGEPAAIRNDGCGIPKTSLIVATAVPASSASSPGGASNRWVQVGVGYAASFAAELARLQRSGWVTKRLSRFG